MATDRLLVCALDETVQHLREQLRQAVQVLRQIRTGDWVVDTLQGRRRRAPQCLACGLQARSTPMSPFTVPPWVRLRGGHGERRETGPHLQPGDWLSIEATAPDPTDLATDAR